MKHSKDPFEAAIEEEEVSPPESPVGLDENETEDQAALNVSAHGGDDANINPGPENRLTSRNVPISAGTAGPSSSKIKEEDEEEEEENMDVQLGKFASSSDPDKLSKMQSILSQFTEEQMSRYESFRRSGFQKSNMKRLLTSITGNSKISIPMTIVVSGIAKLFVGELVETARMVMAERKDTGPIRPCHMREAYRRLKLEGKIPKGSVPRLFR
ncbi:transcription initiation factor TFIID subunit 11-like [Lycium ferocissimum]|uniref:transcription initiation factor TFIID subunit 11-like n=1 Tax=Lycium ferocissimum TaxID=112874 RepID=UPI002815DC28|nr:transcription initiation factor TFIID subunit 11-like [Lycium ferocissimum]